MRRLILAGSGLVMALGLGFGVSAGPASASPPPPANHCPLWANPVLHPHPNCYPNETPAELAPYFFAY